jgi:hypothetical protein
VLAPLRFDSRRLTVALASARATLLGQPISRIRLAVAAAVQVQHPSLAIRFSSRLGSPDPLRPFRRCTASIIDTCRKLSIWHCGDQVSILSWMDVRRLSQSMHAPKGNAHPKKRRNF